MSEARPDARGRRRQALTRLLPGALVLALVVWLVDLRELGRHLAGASAVGFASALALAVTGSCTAALRWTRIARGAGAAVGYRQGLLFFFRGITVNTLLPGATVGGDALRALQLARAGNPLLLATLSVVLDRLAGLWGQAVVSLAALAALAAWAAGGEPAPAALPLVSAYAVLLAGLAAAPWLPVERLPIDRMSGRLAGAGERLRSIAGGWRGFRAGRRGELALIGLLAVAVAACYSTAFWLCLRAVGLEAPYLLTVAVAAAIFIAGSMPVAVAGFGPREVGAAAAFAALGTGAAPATAAAILYGLAGTVQGLAASPLFLLRAGLARALAR